MTAIEKLREIQNEEVNNGFTNGSLWNDLEDFQLQTPYKGYYQIFGHSWGRRTKPVITDKYAMLDCCKPFVLNTETKQIEECRI